MRALLLVALLSTGCTYRYIQSVEDGPTSDMGTRTTVLRTVDTKDFVLLRQTKIVHWECADSGNGLTCRQTCDVKDDQGELLACPKMIGGGL
ncbi:MAG: hypothetical protein EP330_05350 [Deltaproteobacteria bacterium]|nr:MAG: hypothetical protein EP330_05350 [Deltaproteobacteria bacterium]